MSRPRTYTFKPHIRPVQPGGRRAVQWLCFPMYMALGIDGDRKLAITLQTVDGKSYNAIAVETTASGVQGILDSHAHEYLGEGTITTMKRIARNYLRAWAAKREAQKPRCVCGPIDDDAEGAPRARATDGRERN